MANEIQAIAAAAARYSSENIELKAKLAEIERQLSSLLSSDHPGDEIWKVYNAIQMFNTLHGII